MSIGFGVRCELNGGGRTPRPVSTWKGQAVLVDACNLHEGSSKGCKHCGYPSGKEEDDQNRDADPCAPQATKPTVVIPIILVVGRFEMAPS